MDGCKTTPAPAGTGHEGKPQYGTGDYSNSTFKFPNYRCISGGALEIMIEGSLRCMAFLDLPCTKWQVWPDKKSLSHGMSAEEFPFAKLAGAVA